MIVCSTCKTVFTDQESKIICCDRCELWFCISCANVTDVCCKFLSSEDAIDITWYCKTCKLLAKKAITEDRNIEQKCMEYTKELKQKMISIEAIIQRKADVTELQELQKKVEENENKIKELMENSNEVKTWADIMNTPEKRTVEEVIAKSLKERDNEKERQNRRRNIIVFELPESKKSEPEDRKEEDMKKFVGFCKGIININFDQSMIERIIRLGKAMDDKHQPLLISLKEEDKKRDIFQNLNKIRESEVPFNKINIAHDLTKKQKEELQEKIKEAQEKEENDHSGEWIYRV